MGKKVDPNKPYDDGPFLRYYRAVNESWPEALVYHLGGRGFCAELTSVARAMAYAWHHGLQLVLDSSEFAYRYDRGWDDYFVPFCKDVSEVPPDRVREHFDFHRNRKHFSGLRAFNPKEFRFGAHRFDELQGRLAHFTRLIFCIGDEAEREVDALRSDLGLRRDYVALHIRRGDKVGDEDIFYPVERYFEGLRGIGGLRKRPVFVLSDDYEAVVEVSEFLEKHGRPNPVRTLCRREHRGFSVKKLQAGEGFAGDRAGIESEAAFRRYAWDESVRLIAEISIAADASHFVTTAQSNVGLTIWYLHRDHERCARIG